MDHCPVPRKAGLTVLLPTVVLAIPWQLVPVGIKMAVLIKHHTL